MMVLRSWDPTMMVRSGVWQWCCERGVWPGSWDFKVGPWKTIVEFLPLGHRVGFRPFVSIRKTFKNCLSSRAEEPNSEINKLFVPEKRMYLSLPIVFCICICTVVIYIIMVVSIQQPVYKKEKFWFVLRSKNLLFDKV